MVVQIYLILVFTFICLFHVYWAFGGKRGARVAIPENESGPLFKPDKLPTLIIAAVFFFGSVLVLMDIYEYRFVFLQKYLYHFIAVVFFLRGVGEFKYVGLFKKVRNTGFARYDYFFYVPLCFSISLGSVYILLYA